MKYSDPVNWRFLDTHSGNAFFNMAVDEAVLQSIACGESPPTFRVYSWNPPAISFGYAQRISREIDIDRCADAGIDIVRRPTGGRAVLHWSELTYSVLCSAEDSLLGGAIADAYRKISISLVAGLHRLGVAAKFEPGRKPVPSPRGRDLTLPCFSSTAQYEITIDGKKIVGSAQRRLDRMLLQHGSLLVGPEHKQIVNYLPNGRSDFARRFRKKLDAHTISLEEAMGRSVSLDEVSSALKEGLKDTLDVKLKEEPLTTAENSNVEALIREKYGTDAWNFKDESKVII